MITCVHSENLNEFGALWHRQFLLRHEGFIERQDYNVKTFRGMEYDQYDTPAASYLVYHTDEGEVLGVNRLTPVTQGCMLQDLWPDLVEDQTLFESPVVWEGTRYCITKDASPELRQRIIHEMAIAYLEFGLSRGLTWIIGMMPTYIYRSVFERPGIAMRYLGDIAVVGRHKVRAVAIPVEAQQLANVRQKTGITENVLRHTLQQPTQERAYAKAA
jgi:acyl homoserine lactone synthase